MTHTSPKAPKDRAWNWHGTAEAEKGDEILERGRLEPVRAPRGRSEADLVRVDQPLLPHPW